MKFEAWASPPYIAKFRYADGTEEVSSMHRDGPAPACVTLVVDVDGGMLTFYVPVDQAEQLSAKLADAAAAARAMPVEERVHQARRTKAEYEAEAAAKVDQVLRGGR